MAGTTAGWRDEFVLSRDIRAIGRHSELIRDVRHGRLLPVVRGVYRWAHFLPSDPARLTDDAYLAKVRASHLLASDPMVFAGMAAAVAWELPLIGEAPTRVATATQYADGGRSNSSIVRSYLGPQATPVTRDGLTVTSLARTVVDVARTSSFSQATAIADAALHGQAATEYRRFRQALAPNALRSELAAFGSVAGAAKCRGILAFADGASGSPGESVSRAGIRLLGLPAPLLQVPFFDRGGLIGVVDFHWPDFNLIGEFDGRGKYLRDEYTNGRTVAEIVLEEKDRENRLRACGPSVTRWGWGTARSLPRLGEHLRAAGLR